MIGIIDVAQQVKLGEEIQWRVPLLFIGFGTGIPVVLFSFPDTFKLESIADGGHDSSDDHVLSGGDGGDGD